MNRLYAGVLAGLLHAVMTSVVHVELALRVEEEHSQFLEQINELANKLKSTQDQHNSFQGLNSTEAEELFCQLKGYIEQSVEEFCALMDNIEQETSSRYVIAAVEQARKELTPQHQSRHEW